MSPSYRIHLSARAIPLLALIALLLPALGGGAGQASARNLSTAAPVGPAVQGPFSGETAYPTVSPGPLSAINPQEAQPPLTGALPFKQTPGTQRKGASTTIANWVDRLAQTWPGPGLMPGTSSSFEGMNFQANGAGWPPDTVGDVGPNHYVQAVNTSLGVYLKSNGSLVSAQSYNSFFRTATPPCNTQNSGDVVVVYDRFAGRWVVSDFSIANPTGPYYECIAISGNSDPMGLWTFYTLKISDNAINDYPKMGVWRDAYYLTFNMFVEPGDVWGGVQVWALNKTEMLAGAPLHPIYFALSAASGYQSLLPANALSAPGASEPEYLVSAAPPDQVQLWKFSPNFVITTTSVFTGPVVLNVADFAIAASIPQPGTAMVLDSLSYRPMMQLQYRTVNGVTSLWMNHTVASGGVGAIRWYELRDPGGAPLIYQQGTYQPDSRHRWMGSLAVDKDGNMAVGYSLGGASQFASIAYTGRMKGEVPGALPQGEAVLVQGGGSQTVNTRWGDYSAMSVDPNDDCTFWYTNEYYTANGSIWHTRIGSFKYPSCGLAKGYLNGTVRNSASLAPVAGARISAVSPGASFTTLSDGSGYYSMTLATGAYTLTAGPLPPGYPISTTLTGVAVTAPAVSSQDISLAPRSHLAEGTLAVADPESPYGDEDGFAEPGEQGIQLTEGLTNDGAATAAGVHASLASSTPGVLINNLAATYPDISPGQTLNNITPFLFSLVSNVPCGVSLQFTKTITTSQGVTALGFSLPAGRPVGFIDVLTNHVESGPAGWTTGGLQNSWAITTESAHSSSHSWTDSPGGNYLDDTNSYLKSPAMDLSGKRGVQISAWLTYNLEPGYDFVYLEYSLDGGTNWEPAPLAMYNSRQTTWTNVVVDAPQLDNQPDVAIRYRLATDAGVTADGIHIDDIEVSYQAYACNFTPSVPDSPQRVAPANGGHPTSSVTFQWTAAGAGPAPQGYHLIVDGDVVTTTTALSYTLSLPLGTHTWNVTAFDAAGQSVPGPDWVFYASRNYYLAVVRR